MVRPSRSRPAPDRPIRRYCHVCGMPRDLTILEAARVPRDSVLDVCDVCVDTVMLIGRRVAEEEGLTEFVDGLMAFEKAEGLGSN